LNGVSNITPLEKLAVERGAYVVTLGSASATVHLGPGYLALSDGMRRLVSGEKLSFPNALGVQKETSHEEE
jgi:hypothetical protein